MLTGVLADSVGLGGLTGIGGADETMRASQPCEVRAFSPRRCDSSSLIATILASRMRRQDGQGTAADRASEGEWQIPLRRLSGFTGLNSLVSRFDARQENLWTRSLKEEL